MKADETKKEAAIGRLGEVLEVLRRHDIVRGLSPEKFCAILEDLGPTFIKLGQIMSMRSDILPREYCEALTRLRTSVAPMPFDEVRRIVETAWQRPIPEVCTFFGEEPLGSASIAQVHAATLFGGAQVVVKVEREGIHETMRRDISLMKKAAELLKYTPMGGVVDFNRVLDEMWNVTQQEMDFLTEAGNLEEFARLNADVRYVSCPKLYRAHTTSNVLVMERIDGLAIDDREKLEAEGYDLKEIGEKLAASYVKQVTDDGFFHADPHPGNLRVRDGQIVFLDMGMMGRLSERDRKSISKALAGIGRGSAEGCVDALLALGAAQGPVDHRQLFRDCEAMLDRYGTEDLGQMDIGVMMAEIIEIMRANHLKMPDSMSMLARGLTTIEGVLAELSPEINVAQVAAAHLSRTFLRDIDWQAALTRDFRSLYESSYKALDLPALSADVLRSINRGEASVCTVTSRDEKDADLLRQLNRQRCLALVCAACVLASALVSPAEPLFLGLGPANWLFGAAALVSALVLFAPAVISRWRKRRKR